MKCIVSSLLIVAFASAMNSCGTGATARPTDETSAVQDQASLLSALQAAGATTEINDSISQEFFSVEGQFITINGTEDIQVFEYPSGEEMESDASQIAPDGGSIGTTMINWVDNPHFYKSGRILILYIGNNETILSLLEKVMGKQFAGP
jgi:hypothetical protein